MEITRPLAVWRVTLQGATDENDSVEADLSKETALAPVLLGPLEGGHLNDLKGIARPSVDETAQLIDLATPLGQLPFGQRHHHEFPSQACDGIEISRAAPRIIFPWQGRVYQ
jgi:hypothetical protein